MNELTTRFDALLEHLKSDAFFENRGLANEVPFYVFPYDPSDELEVRNFVRENLVPDLNRVDRLDVIEIDLFDLMMESIQNDGILEKAIKIEEKKGTDALYKKLKKSFNMDVILGYFKEKVGGKNIVLITGVGKIFPVLRTHNLLNNLQTITGDTKVVLFFPGSYNEESLQLFNFHYNNYYRAFPL